MIALKVLLLCSCKLPGQVLVTVMGPANIYSPGRFHLYLPVALTEVQKAEQLLHCSVSRRCNLPLLIAVFEGWEKV